ncbi:hypothetical protein GTZ99_07420 [Novosphingobium sp. FSY-8]|uniref:Elongation factor P n=1 Tax=Novosphingobium ovatum TaxID=1908523 RepID=A0ABW9XCW0_9SPHN|nr:hypothetical protein [Novosphingobium ovatum]NBC36383.1 hypothetical protein [Novosphingobium ovatum]
MGALSAVRGHWQSLAAWPRDAGGVLFCATVGAMLVMGSAPVAAGTRQADVEGPLIALKRGDFSCELPGDAMGAAGVRLPSEDFTVMQGSMYRTKLGRGTYLATGDMVRITTGPKQGERYHRLSDNFLRKLNPDGTDGAIRCVRKVLNNQ